MYMYVPSIVVFEFVLKAYHSTTRMGLIQYIWSHICPYFYNFILWKVFSMVSKFFFFSSWSAIGIISVNHLVKKGTYIGLYKDVATLLYIFQTAAVLEVSFMTK